MKSLFVPLFVLAFSWQTSSGQLSGIYTVGGSSPDFATVQEAADSLMSLGVAGPVDILIRPGTYEAGNEGDAPALLIDRSIAGLSEANRISFRSDVNAGGSATNVILRRRIGSPVVTIVPGPGQSTVSHVTLQGLSVTVEDAVAPVAGLPAAISLSGLPSDRQRDMRIVGLRIDGGGRRAQFGIYDDDCSTDLQIESNLIRNSAMGVRFRCSNADRFRFADNRLLNVGYRIGGANPAIPSIAHFQFSQAEGPRIENNVIDMNGQCSQWVLVVEPGSIGTVVRDVRIERNLIVNWPCGGGSFANISGAIWTNGLAGYSVVANNMVAVGASDSNIYTSAGPAMNLTQTFDSMLVAHNSVYAWNETSGPIIGASEANGAHVRILNNIFISERLNALETRGSFTRDYNILSNGTGLGPNSIIMTPEFVDTAHDLHLGECAFDDSTLRGTAISQVPFDFDTQARDVMAPFRGADEPAAPPQVFGGPALFDSGTQSFLMASGDLDEDGDVDLVVTNVEPNNGGNDVTLLWNDGTGTFSEPEHLSFGNDPTHVAVGRINADDFLDLVVVATDGVYMRFGTGGGGFAPPVQMFAESAYTDLELADYDNDGDTDVFTLVSPPSDSGLVVVQINEGDGTFSFNDARKVGDYADDLEIVDLDDDGFQDLIVVDNTGSNSMYTLRNLGNQAPGVSYGFDAPVEYPLLIESVPAASQFLVGDFDGDLDPDVILGDAAGDSLVLVRNGGDGTFGGREAFKVHRGAAPRVVAMLDYEGDGDLDLVSASSTNNVDLMLNDGTGMFRRYVLCGSGALSGFPNAMLAATLDDDLSADVAVLTTSDKVELLRNLNWMPSGVGTEEEDGPRQASTPRLDANYPNPFNASTTVRYELTQAAHVRLVVFDLLGRQVATVQDEMRPAGETLVQLNSSGLASGIYFYRLQAGNYVETRRMVVVK